MVATALELSSLGLDAEHFHRSGAKNYRGPCPRCGGHRRFTLFTDHPFPKWNYYCEGCGIKGFADNLNASLKQPISAEQKREWAERNARERVASEKARAARLAEFSTSELWAELAKRMTGEHRTWWEKQGVPIDWQTHLRIGFEPSRVYYGADEQPHTSRAYSLPYFHTGFEFVAMQYRLFDPPVSTDRYRWEKGLGTSFYQTEPQKPIGAEVIICEGAKKAIVTAVHMPDNFTVLGVPSKSDFGGIVEAVQDCPRVYVLLDPDAGSRSKKLADGIGRQARVVELPVKVDDGMMLHGLTAALLCDALKYARPS